MIDACPCPTDDCLADHSTRLPSAHRASRWKRRKFRPSRGTSCSGRGSSCAQQQSCWQYRDRGEVSVGVTGVADHGAPHQLVVVTDGTTSGRQERNPVLGHCRGEAPHPPVGQPSRGSGAEPRSCALKSSLRRTGPTALETVCSMPDAMSAATSRTYLTSSAAASRGSPLAPAARAARIHRRPRRAARRGPWPRCARTSATAGRQSRSWRRRHGLTAARKGG